ncbi:Hpt domain-containing protein [Pelotomaculum terephthalicicum JT]|uniref:Hpt domain-containing protein n=1 Tax=Pelotomaculum TaxID=191373 RepID=UPI0009D59455|nr:MULTISPECIES: Hpt domain-containing protein [Pelotomaculum]MCG9968857.1 Hpt domain-containing protein [Pelotomaculum terephthalicicum JT]OPX85082.1 MAG: Hpt domain protein [Pelotomaculum sp. PtaB.Bin117]
MNNEFNKKIIVRVDKDLAEIIPVFLENRQKDCKSIKEALEKGDYETIRILGHSMKGVGGGYGFDAVTDLGASIEQAAKNKDAAEINNLIDELMTYLDRVEVVFVD